MGTSTRYLNPSEAARRLGVSVKALRVYEARGLIEPARSAAGWRMYGPDDMRRAAQAVAFRALGLSLAQTARMLKDQAPGAEPALVEHQAALEARLHEIVGLLGQVHALRDSRPGLRVSFELPWPWNGERFELQDIRAITYIVGPLFSGKTRLAQRLAATLPGAAFIGLERLAEGAAAAKARLGADAALGARVDRRLATLVRHGATASDALLALVVALETAGPTALVIDMIEQGLDQATQEVLASHLRERGDAARPLFCLTRSSSMLDLRSVGPDEAMIFCPPNHSPPFLVAPHAGAQGHEALAMCLGAPPVRARTEGVVACRPQAA